MAPAQTLYMAIRRAAATLKSSSTPLLDARLLAGHVLGLDAAGLVLAGPEMVSARDLTAFQGLVDRRAGGEPIAYILGEKEFFGLSFEMRAPVLCPRPDSETLIEAAQFHFSDAPPQRILDLGIGSGCLLITLLTLFPKAVGVGIDKSSKAVSLARDNAYRHDVVDRMSVVQGDWMEAVTGEFDLIISNPPYIKMGAEAYLSRDIRFYEDPGALYAGADGLDDYRRILGTFRPCLSEKGVLILELGEGQCAEVKAIADHVGGLTLVQAHTDLAGIHRALVFLASA